MAGNMAVVYVKRLTNEAGAKLILMTAVEWPFGEAVMSGAVAELGRASNRTLSEALTRLLPGPTSTGDAPRRSWPSARPAARLSRSLVYDQQT